MEAYLIPIILGLTEAVKRTKVLNELYVPIISIIIGIGAQFVISPQPTWQMSVVYGIASGLMASGLWSGAKHMAVTVKK